MQEQPEEIIGDVTERSITEDYKSVRTVEVSERIPEVALLAHPHLRQEEPEKLIRDNLGESAGELSMMKEEMSEMTVGTEQAYVRPPNLTSSPLKQSRINMRRNTTQPQPELHKQVKVNSYRRSFIE